MIAVIDTKVANIGSVVSALHRVGAKLQVTNDPREVESAHALLLPGVGAFADGMDSLRRHGLIEPIRAVANACRPVLGVCLGMQLLADAGEEFGHHEGLGLVPGRVVRLPAMTGMRIPNIGWCDVEVQPGAASFAGVESGSSFYFVHSYCMVCVDPEDCVGSIGLSGRPISVAVERGNVWGAQFHPEKSGDAGLAFLANFVAAAKQ